MKRPLMHKSVVVNGVRLTAGEYALASAGPLCTCTHRRVDHVGKSRATGIEFYDGRCQIAGCTGCETSGYIPHDRPYSEVHP